MNTIDFSHFLGKDFIDYYKILQVDQGAENDVIQAAYRRLCRKYHPDVASNHTEDTNYHDRMLLFNKAYEVIGRASDRAAYDGRIKRAKLLEQGYGTLCKYLMTIARREYQSAFDMLTLEDRSKARLEDFRDWQAAVAKIYQIVDIQLVDYNISEDGNRVGYCLRITDRNNVTDSLADTEVQKELVIEDGQWHVVLGHDDIQGLTEKFKLVTTAEMIKNNVSDRKRVIHRITEESVRCERYGNAFCVGILQIDAGNYALDSLGDVKKRLLHSIVYTCIDEHVRASDMVASLGLFTFTVVLIQTEAQQAASVLLGLSKQIERYLGINAICISGVAQYAGEKPEQLLKKAGKLIHKRLKAAR